MSRGRSSWNRRVRRYRRRARRQAPAVLVILSSVIVVSILGVGYAHWHAETSGATADLPPAPITSSAPPKVATVFMGDSVTQGDTPSFEDDPGPLSWVSYVLGDERSPWLYQANVAVAGQTTGEMLARFQRDVLRRHPAGVVILAGTNDIDQGVSLATSLDNLRQMIDAAEHDGAEVWVVTPPPWAAHVEELAAFRAAEKDLATQAGATFLDTYPALAAPDGGYRKGLTVDGIHPSERGARRLAEAVVTAAS